MQPQQVQQDGRLLHRGAQTWQSTPCKHFPLSIFEYFVTHCLLLAVIQPLTASSNACLYILYSNFVLLDIHYSAQFLCKTVMYLLGEMFAQELPDFFFFSSGFSAFPVSYWVTTNTDEKCGFLGSNWKSSSRVMILLSLCLFLLCNWFNKSRLNKTIISVSYILHGSIYS